MKVDGGTQSRGARKIYGPEDATGRVWTALQAKFICKSNKLKIIQMYINKALLSNVVYSLIYSVVCSFAYSLNIHKVKSESEVAQSYPTLCDAMDCSLPVSSVHRIFQARVLKWVAISFSRGSSRPRDQTWVSHIVGRCFTIWASREVPTDRSDRLQKSPSFRKNLDLILSLFHCSFACRN